LHCSSGTFIAGKVSGTTRQNATPPAPCGKGESMHGCHAKVASRQQLPASQHAFLACQSHTRHLVSSVTRVTHPPAASRRPLTRLTSPSIVCSSSMSLAGSRPRSRSSCRSREQQG
jgi:hypothetical protein